LVFRNKKSELIGNNIDNWNTVLQSDRCVQTGGPNSEVANLLDQMKSLFNFDEEPSTDTGRERHRMFRRLRRALFCIPMIAYRYLLSSSLNHEMPLGLKTRLDLRPRHTISVATKEKKFALELGVMELVGMPARMVGAAARPAVQYAGGASRLNAHRRAGFDTAGAFDSAGATTGRR
jgi:hypothetical protein